MCSGGEMRFGFCAMIALRLEDGRTFCVRCGLTSDKFYKVHSVSRALMDNLAFAFEIDLS